MDFFKRSRTENDANGLYDNTFFPMTDFCTNSDNGSHSIGRGTFPGNRKTILEDIIEVDMIDTTPMFNKEQS